jgi:hypothetical protein
LANGCRAWLHYAYCVRHAARRAFGEWLLTALVALVLLEIAAQVIPGHRLTFPVIAVAIGAATLGKAFWHCAWRAGRRGA